MAELKISEPEKTTIVSIVANFLLLIIKLLGGFLGSSQALLADALNSLLDLIANSIVYLGRLISQKPPDSGHRYGHGHADTLAAMLVATIIALTGFFIGYQAIHVIIDRHYSTPTFLATAVAAATIITKGILYRWTIRIGKKHGSPAIVANAYDHRSDVFASLGALIGIVAAQLKWPVLDPIASIWIALLIVRNAAHLYKENIHMLMSGAPEPEAERQVRETLQSISGIKHLRDIRIRAMGPFLLVDLKIEVDGCLSVGQGHEIATQCKKELKMSNNRIQDVMVHIEPFRTAEKD